MGVISGSWLRCSLFPQFKNYLDFISKPNCILSNLNLLQLHFKDLLRPEKGEFFLYFLAPDTELPGVCSSLEARGHPHSSLSRQSCSITFYGLVNLRFIPVYDFIIACLFKDTFFTSENMRHISHGSWQFLLCLWSIIDSHL